MINSQRLFHQGLLPKFPQRTPLNNEDPRAKVTENIRSDFIQFLKEDSEKYGRTMRGIVLGLYLNTWISKLLGNSSYDPRVLRRNFLLTFAITVGAIVCGVALLPFIFPYQVFDIWRLVMSLALISFLACGTIGVKFRILRVIGTDPSDSE